jgi:radical SAM superfamily enzyme YgiQ (UPF0313 family)
LDVLFINPYDENAVKNGLGYVTPPPGLMYLGAALEKSAMSVKIIDDDLLQMGYDKVSKLAEKVNPQIVGITANTSTIKNATRYLKLIKNVLPNALTVIGGPHSSFLPTETLKSSPALDVVVIGEGEKTITELADHICNKNKVNLEEIKGIAYKDLNNGNIKLNPPRPLIRNLDSIPFPARHLVPFESYGTTKNGSGDMITSRGCVYSCGYCSSSLIMGKRFRARSPDNVVDELEDLVYNYKIKDVAFMDDTFMLNKRRANDISNEIENRGLDVSFIASSRVDMVDKKLLEKLKGSGLATLYYGVESGSQRVLDMMRKGITIEQAENAVKSAKEVGINVITSFILGFPGETSKEIDKTIDFSIKLDADYSQYSILTPFPGTPIYHELKEKELIATENWDKYTVLESVINYDKIGLSKKLVERKLAKAYLKFYTRPNYLLKHRHVLKVIIETLLRSFVLPKIKGNPAKGWYKTIKS